MEGLVAKIHQSLRPHIAEMFFARLPVLVEGLEDASYITTTLHLSGQWEEFRRLGCHLIPVNGKDKILQPLAIAKELGIPVFVVFDADGNAVREEHRNLHRRDNAAILHLLGAGIEAFPTADVISADYAVWKHSLTEMVEENCGPECARYKDIARTHYAQEGGLEKNHLFIADWLEEAHRGGT